MGIVARVLFVLNGAVLTFVLVTPLVDRAMSWDEAGWAIVACLFLSPVFAALAIRFVPKKARDKPDDTASWRRRWALILGLAGVGKSYSQEPEMDGPKKSLRGAYAKSTRCDP